MPRNASGTYTLPLPPVISDTIIESVWANTSLDDIAQSLTDSLDRYGRGAMVGPFRFADGTVGQPGAAWTAETGTGFYRASAGVLNAAVLGAYVAGFTANGPVVPTGKTLALADFPTATTDAANKSYVDAQDTTTLNSAKTYADAAVAALAVPARGQLPINATDITASRALTAADFGTGIIRINSAGVVAITVPTLAAMGLPLTPGFVRTIAFEIVGVGIPTFAGATASTSINAVNGPTTVLPVNGAPKQHQYVVLSQRASGADAWLLN
jgi:hypothetical protein